MKTTDAWEHFKAACHLKKWNFKNTNHENACLKSIAELLTPYSTHNACACGGR